MADEILQFGGFEASEQDESAASKGSSGLVSGLTKDGSTSTASIDGSSLMAGTYALKVDPVNGNSLLDTYGGQVKVAADVGPRFLAIMFTWRFEQAVEFDDEVTICEYHKGIADTARRIIFDLNDKLQLQDTDGDRIGDIGGTTLLKDTDYFFYWYINLLGTTRDIVWIRTSTTWSNEIDVVGHGDVGSFNPTQVTFGSGTGKLLPTAGGPMHYDDWCIIENPTSSGIGSIVTRYKKANANGGDSSFTDQAFGDVDDLPADLGTGAVDTGDAVGERNSYGLESAESGETPLAVLPVGSGQGTAANITQKLYLFDGTTRDYVIDSAANINTHRHLTLSETHAKTTMPDGSAFTETKFNDDLQVGCEIVAIPSGNFELDQIGVEYMKAGSQGLPSDFPTDVGTGEEVLGPIFIT